MKKLQQVLKDVEFLILKQNFKSSSNDFFIYKMSPSQKDRSRMIENPKFGFSIFTGSEYHPGAVINADLNEYYDNSKNEYSYELKRVLYKWASTREGQWDFLDRFSKNAHYRKMYKLISENFMNIDLILNYITASKNKDQILTKIALENDSNTTDLFQEFIDELNSYKDSANFLSLLPEDVQDVLTDTQSKKLIKLVPNNPEQSAIEFLEHPFKAMALDGFGFKILDDIRGKLYNIADDEDKYKYALENDERVWYGAYYVVERQVFGNGDTYVELSQFEKYMIHELEIAPELVRNFVTKDYESLMFNNDFNIKIVQNKVTTQKMWDAEWLIAETLDKSNLKPVVNFEQKFDHFNEKNELTLSDEQRSVFTSINQNKFNMLVGPGGVGKTWTVGNLIKFVKEELNWNVLLTAPTGKAAQVLSGYTQENARTLHSAFKIIPGKDAELDMSERIDLFVIDEFSMVDSTLLATVLSVLNNPEQRNIRFLFVGDEFQLPSVGAGNVLHTLIDEDMIHLTRLTKVFRTKDSKGGITTLSTQLREGKVTLKNNDNAVYAVGKDLAVQNCTSSELIRSRIVSSYSHMLKENISPEDIMVIVPKNKGITGQTDLNNDIQLLIRNNFKNDTASQIDDEFSLMRKVYGQEVHFYLNDLVMFNKNSKLIQAFDIESAMDSDLTELALVNNGDTGKIIDINEDGMIVSVIGQDTPVFIDNKSIDLLTLGYVMTIHKSQGSQAKYGIMGISKSDMYMLNANLMYTGVSRFKERLYFFADLRTVRIKGQVFSNQNRQTLLQYFAQNKKAVF